MVHTVVRCRARMARRHCKLHRLTEAELHAHAHVLVHVHVHAYVYRLTAAELAATS